MCEQGMPRFVMVISISGWGVLFAVQASGISPTMYCVISFLIVLRLPQRCRRWRDVF
ncbi:E12 [Escherichia phage Mu]|nr:E12 [Escherichia phage Mu]